jgi:hypothetical protein
MLIAEGLPEDAGGMQPLVVNVTNFIQATRDSRYRNTAAAFAESVDNSVEAGATRVPA